MGNMIWSPELLALVTGTFLLAGMVKGVIGMALPTVSLGILAAVLGLKDAIILMLVPSLVTNFWQGVIGGHLLSLLKRLWLLLATMALGIFFATEALTMQDTSVLEVILGLTLISYGVFSLAIPIIPTLVRGERVISLFIGGSTGIIAGLTGSTVLPVVPYLRALGMSRDAFIQAMGICFSVAALVLGLALQSRNLLPIDLSLLSAVGILPAIVGMMIGQTIRKQLSEKRFKQVFFISVIFLGGYIVAQVYVL